MAEIRRLWRQCGDSDPYTDHHLNKGDADLGAGLTFLEFFAGGGMARIGLGPGWRCLLANDRDPMKCAAYRANFGGEDIVEKDVAALALSDLPAEQADLAWASFPCQDFTSAANDLGQNFGLPLFPKLNIL